MKWISTFLIGMVIGAIGIAGYLYSRAPNTPAVAPPVVTAPAAVKPAPPVALAPAPAPSLPATPAPAPAPAPAPDPAASKPVVVIPSGDKPAASASEALASGSPAAPPSSANVAVPVTGQLLIPVAGISAAQLRDTFNDARGAERRHEALDILAPQGTPVLAVDDGKVAKLFDSKPGGLTVYQFNKSENMAYYYAHLDRYAPGVKEGSILKRGDLIGYVGSTGNADPATPHLHFAIFELGPEKQWWKGSPINPYPLLGGVKRAG